MAGKHHGVRIKYYNGPDGGGCIHYTQEYKYGVKDGLFIKYYHNGNLCERAVWADGRPHGLVEHFRDGGVPARAIEYKDGLAEGTYRIYHPCGAIRIDAFKLCNEFHGKRDTYGPNGSLWITAYFLYGDAVTEAVWRHHELTIKLAGIDS